MNKYIKNITLIILALVLTASLRPIKGTIGTVNVETVFGDEVVKQ